MSLTRFLQPLKMYKILGFVILQKKSLMKSAGQIGFFIQYKLIIVEPALLYGTCINCKNNVK